MQERLVRDAVPAPRVAQGPRGHLFQVPRAAGQAPGVQEPVGLRAGGVVGADARLVRSAEVERLVRRRDDAAGVPLQ